MKEFKIIATNPEIKGTIEIALNQYHALPLDGDTYIIGDVTVMMLEHELELLTPGIHYQIAAHCPGENAKGLMISLNAQLSEMKSLMEEQKRKLDTLAKSF